MEQRGAQHPALFRYVAWFEDFYAAGVAAPPTSKTLIIPSIACGTPVFSSGTKRSSVSAHDPR